MPECPEPRGVYRCPLSMTRARSPASHCIPSCLSHPATDSLGKGSGTPRRSRCPEKRPGRESLETEGSSGIAPVPGR
jgi:hypothetical protein